MSDAPPMAFAWDGEVMRPRQPRLADRHYVVGEVYTLEPRHGRSTASHNHYFAAIEEAWQNLPDALAERFRSSEALRKHALIQAGYRYERSIVCASKAEALRVAAFVDGMDEYAFVTVRDAVVIVYTAKSQSLRAMGKVAFQDSKDAVLGVLAAMLGTTPGELAKAGEAA